MAVAEKTVTSLVPKDAVRPRELSEVVNKLSWKMSFERHTRTGDDSIRDFFNEHSIEADEALTKKIITEVHRLTVADQVYDSEQRQAYRALFPILKELLPTTATEGYPTYLTINAVGWIRGETVRINGERFELTGDECERCGVNPKAHGIGGGVRCVNTRECGWWYCA